MARKENMPGQTDRTALPTVLVIGSDPMLLKLLTMALTLELACEVFTVDNSRKAEEIAQHFRPALLILDEGLSNGKTHELSDRLHQIAGLEQLPTLFLNGTVVSQNKSKGYPTCILKWSWKIETLYAAVRTLLD